MRGQVNQKTQNICITFVQHRPNVFDGGPTLYKCYTNVLCWLGQYGTPAISYFTSIDSTRNVHIPANTRRWTNFGSMLAHRLRNLHHYRLLQITSNPQTQNICITFVQHRPNVFDVGSIFFVQMLGLYKWLGICQYTLLAVETDCTVLCVMSICNSCYIIHHVKHGASKHEPLNQCWFNGWPIVSEAGPTLNQHWFDVSWLL